MKAQANQFIGCGREFEGARVVLFGAPYGLTIESEPGVKTVVSIAMPARSREELEAYVQSNHRG